MAGILGLPLQINTAKRLLEKGKEKAEQEPERSWFQTKEERKKEKSKSDQA
jgi:ATP-dependent RNA helicase DDX27